MSQPQRTLFLCTGNSCRSQMAEGWAKHLHAEQFEVYSAGVEVHGMNPNARLVMAEQGVDIGDQQSQHVDELADIDFDILVTVCPSARERCPNIPGNQRVIHMAFDDPPKLAKAAIAAGASDDEALDHYRRVCGDIRDFVADLPTLIA